MSLVKLDWQRKPVSEKLIKCSYIIDQMTANVVTFATPNPALADVTAAKDDLGAKAVAAQAGGYALTFAKNEAEKVLDQLMSQLASYVQNISGGDAGIILLSGMEVRKEPSPLPLPGQVENLDAYPTRTQGEIQLTWDTLGSEYYYQVEMWQEDAGDGFWDKLAVVSKSKYTVTGFTTGTVYRFRVAGIGKNDELGPYSQEASSVAP